MNNTQKSIPPTEEEPGGSSSTLTEVVPHAVQKSSLPNLAFPSLDYPLSRQKKPLFVRTIGIAFNLKEEGASDDRYEEYDDIETIEALKKELEQLGFRVILLEQNGNFLENILKARPDFVFNIAEGIGATRSRESQIPCILESLEIPHSGSDPVSLGLALDKHLTNLVLQAAQVPVPAMYLVKYEGEIEGLRSIFKKKHLYVVKPRWEGSSKGIFLNSVVSNLKDLRERILYIFSQYHQPALVEEFLEREEITAGVCGNGSPSLLGMMKITPQDASQRFFLYTLENKREWQTKVKYEPQKTITVPIQRLVKKYALMAYRALELQDLARLDFRVDRNNVPRIIDVNPLPGLSPHYSDLPILYKLKGRTYSDLIKTILKASFKRYGFEWQHS